MPKKFKGENSKASVAKAMKNARLEEEKEKKQRAEEDEFWKDEDKSVKRKQDRKAERDRKRADQVAHKQELKQLAEWEVHDLHGKAVAATGGEAASSKVTRAQIQAHQAMIKQEAGKRKEEPLYTEQPLEENVNRLEDEHIAARGLDEALTVLTVSERTDQHPERRMKAAYAAFEERTLPRMKADNPNMRLSQVKQLVKKDWMRSPENPMNKAIIQAQQ